MEGVGRKGGGRMGEGGMAVWVFFSAAGDDDDMVASGGGDDGGGGCV